MRILFSTGSPAGYMAPPRLGEDQVNCGPDWKSVDVDGRVISLATPVGEFDLAQVASRLPTDQQPDAVVCLVDSSRRALPRNLGAFRCPKVLLIADTHHLVAPIRRMIDYARSEPFDRLVLLYTRNHWDFFQAAGFDNLFWFPGLTFPHTDREVAAVRAGPRVPQAAFVGQTGIHHPRRLRLFSAFGPRQIPLVIRAIPQREALALYGQSLVGINASLNGDLNLRNLEILASGALLLADELAPLAGVDELWTVGRELLTYRSAEELADRAEQAIARPAEARRIGKAGAAWFDRHFNEARRRRLFQDLAMNGKAPDLFARPSTPTLYRHRPALETHLRLTAGYEHVQELHRHADQVVVGLDDSVPEEFAAMCRTLPHVVVQRGRPAANAALAFLAIGRADPPPPVGGAAHVWYWDASPADQPALVARCAPLGLHPVDATLALFSRTLAAPAVGLGAQALAQLKAGRFDAALALAKQDLSTNPASVDALLTIVELAQITGNATVGQIYRTRLAQVAPHHPRLHSPPPAVAANPV